MSLPAESESPRWLTILASPHPAAFANAWLFVLVVVGTLAQVDLGLYQAQERWFSAWFFFAFDWLPLPGGRATFALMAINLIAHLGTKRGLTWPGLVLLHVGVVLLLAAGLIGGAFRREGSLALAEGESGAEMVSYRHHELVVSSSDGKNERLTRFGEGLLVPGATLNHPALALPLTVVTHHRNARLVGSRLGALPPNPEPSDNQPGVVLLAAGREVNVLAYETPPTVDHQGQSYRLGIRSAVTPLPFNVRLLKFTRDLHPGTGMAKAYQSEVEFTVDGTTRRVVISMNQPLRHQGWTLYQSSFQQGAQTVSVFTVVHDRFQYSIYFASLIMGAGLLVHILDRMLRRVPAGPANGTAPAAGDSA